MTKEELKLRTKQFALSIIKLAEDLPQNKAGNTIGNQMIRSGTSVAANYRAACKAGSSADFISKITNELTAIFTASGKTAKNNNPKSAIRNSK